MRQVRPIAVAILVVTLVMVRAASAAIVPWLTPTDLNHNANFGYANGHTFNGLFVAANTNPIITPTGLIVFPSQFIAEGVDGSAQLTDDTLEFEIHLKPQKVLTQFIVNEFGDYTIDGTGPGTSVKASGGLFLINMDDPFALPISVALGTTPAALSTGTGLTSGEGLWTANATVINIPAGWTNIQVILNNELSATSDPGTTSFIQKKVGQVGLEITLVIPEPGTISLGLLSSLAVLARRGRRVMA